MNPYLLGILEGYLISSSLSFLFLQYPTPFFRLKGDLISIDLKQVQNQGFNFPRTPNNSTKYNMYIQTYETCTQKLKNFLTGFLPKIHIQTRNIQIGDISELSIQTNLSHLTQCYSYDSDAYQQPNGQHLVRLHFVMVATNFTSSLSVFPTPLIILQRFHESLCWSWILQNSTLARSSTEQG